MADRFSNAQMETSKVQKEKQRWKELLFSKNPRYTPEETRLGIRIVFLGLLALILLHEWLSDDSYWSWNGVLKINQELDATYGYFAFPAKILVLLFAYFAMRNLSRVMGAVSRTAVAPDKDFDHALEKIEHPDRKFFSFYQSLNVTLRKIFDTLLVILVVAAALYAFIMVWVGFYNLVSK